jgi:hypothetical protein
VEGQLEVLAALIDATDRAAIPVWFFGGHGIDALAGRATRLHGDIDILARADDALRLRDAAIENGFQIKALDLPHHVTASRGDHHVDCVLWREREDGVRVLDAGGRGTFVCPEGAFPDERNGSLCGRPVRAASWEALYLLKAGYSSYEPGAELRGKDRQDLELLCRHVSPSRRKALEAHFQPLPGTRTASG